MRAAFTLRHPGRASRRALRGAMLLLAAAAPACDHSGGKSTAPAQRRAPILLVGRHQHDRAFSMAATLAKRHDTLLRRTVTTVVAPPEPTDEALERLLADIDPGAYRAICVWADHPDAVAERLGVLGRAGAAIVLLGRDSPDCGRAAFCGTDGHDIGVALARALGAALSSQADAGAGALYDSDPHRQARWTAFRDELLSTTRVALLREVSWSGRVDARALLQRELEKYPRMAGWALLDAAPVSARPVGQPVVPRDAVLVLYSDEVAALAWLRGGAAAAVVVPDAVQIARRGLAMATELARGAELQLREERIAPLIVTPQTLDQYESRWSAVED